MLKILVPVDGSESCLRAVRHACALAGGAPAARLYLLNVQTPPRGRAGLSRMITQEMIDDFYRREGEDALKDALALARTAQTAHTAEVALGKPAQEIVEHARRHGCERIVMGSRGNGALAGVFLGSVANQVLQLSDLPVTLLR